jgi:phytoene dehydrogenase-like protein
MPDAVVIGAGPNGLVAANLLVDAGWSVAVFEAQSAAGGAVRSAEVTAPGFTNDLFSAFYPLTASSPVMQRLRLEDWGLQWRHAPTVLAHPTPNGPAALLSRDLDTTCASLDRFAPGDGDAWRDLYGLFDRATPAFLELLLDPFPPVRATATLAARLRVSRGAELARLALLSVRRMATERFRGEGGRLLLTGNAMHADVSPESAGSGLFGFVLAGLGQQVGYPVPRGGAQGITDALVSRLTANGGSLVCGAHVDRVIVRNGRAVGIDIAGESVTATKAVLADTDVIALYRHLVGAAHLPARVMDRLTRFERGPGTVKIDWALAEPVPWSDAAVRGAGTVHLADSSQELTFTTAELASGLVPSKPFVLLGQMTTSDASRSPEGTEAVWAYARVPQEVRGDAGPDAITGKWNERETEAFVRRMEDRIESHAPGFRDRIVARHTMSPPELEAADENLVLGDLSGGTAQLHQQLVFRPLPGLGRAETPVKGLYLASASAHPGAGVHGACGANAARAALFHDRLRRRGRRARRSDEAIMMES